MSDVKVAQNKAAPRLMAPQQYPGYPGVRPPKGWVPPLGQVLELLGVYDSESGYWVGLPLQALTEALVHPEQLHSLGKVDSRDGATLTVPNGTATGAYATRKKIEVPADEVWFLSQMELITPAQQGGIVLANVRISAWKDPGGDADGQAFWASNRGQAAGGVYVAECYGCAPAFVTLGDAIGAPLRLPPGSTLAIVAEVTAAALTAARDVTLNPYGWKGKWLVA